MIRTAVLLALLLGASAEAAELRDLSVDYEKGIYTMQSEVWFDVNIDRIWTVFRRWDYSAEFSSAIVEARDMEADEQGRPQYYSRMRGCVLFFCRSMVRQGYVEEEEQRIIKAFANPEISDFHKADESWTFSEKDGGTIVIYDLSMRPKFWVPPGIGPYIIKRKLKKDGGGAIDRIEAVAQSLPDE